MTWLPYRLTFRLCSPLHAGFHKVGYLQRTRRYVPARTMRGAAIARLAAVLGLTGDNAYRALQDEADRRLAFGYFYPALETSGSYQPTLVGGETRYVSAQGDWLTPAAFDRLFLTTITSTAIQDRQRSALDGSLHEVECLAPVTSTEEAVYLTGCLFVANHGGPGSWLALNPANSDVQLRHAGQKVSLFSDVLDGIQAGGERRYGFGCLSLVQMEEQQPPGFDGTGTWPAYTIAANAPFGAHTDVVACPTAYGSIEPLLGRITTQGNRFGQTLSEAHICWTPESGPNPEMAGTYELRSDGILYRQPSPARTT